jgi:hypothetical protein
MFLIYLEQCSTHQLDIGTLFLFEAPQKLILNFPTKRHFRDPSKLEYIVKGLDVFCGYVSRRKITSAAFPALGCGLGGLHWAVVYPLMRDRLVTLNIPVEIYAPTSAT